MWEVYEFLARGGPVMIPIALGSVTALAILFERLWSLRRGALLPPKLSGAAAKLLSDGRADDALEASRRSPTPLGRVFEACLKYRHLERSEIREAIEDVGRREIASMSRPIEALGIIAAVSPLLGLLGTVTGMIRAFRQVVTSASRGAIDPGQLANGIWEALITTAAGLSVAILSYLAYRYLQSRVNRVAGDLELQALELLDLVTDAVPAKVEGRSRKDATGRSGEGDEATVESNEHDEAVVQAEEAAP